MADQDEYRELAKHKAKTEKKVNFDQSESQEETTNIQVSKKKYSNK